MSQSLKGSDLQFPHHEPGREVGMVEGTLNVCHMGKKDDTKQGIKVSFSTTVF